MISPSPNPHRIKREFPDRHYKDSFEKKSLKIILKPESNLVIIEYMHLFKDTHFLKSLFSLAIPVILQNVLSASLNFIDVFMIGKLGDTAVAAVGAANQFFFFYLMIIFGTASGAGIFAAQYWGKKDIRGILSIVSVSVWTAVIPGILFFLLVLMYPSLIMRLFITNQEVVHLGNQYLVIISLSYLLLPLGMVYSVILRSTGQVKLPMYASMVGVVTNTAGNYILIFGKFGFPEMGVQGAAIATIFARLLEMAMLLLYVYSSRNPVPIRFRNLFDIDKKLAKKYFRVSIPIVLQGAGWSLGYTMYAIVYGHMSTESFAAYNLACSVERICLILFIGFGVACSIMIGNNIGNDNKQKAYSDAGRVLLLTFIAGLFIGMILFLSTNYVVSFYNLSDKGKEYFAGILVVMSTILFAKALNIVFHGGIFKAGGDTTFSMIVDVGGIWGVGVPLAAIGAFMLHLPVYLVVALTCAEEITKAIVALYRFFSRKWIHTLIEPAKPVEELAGA